MPNRIVREGILSSDRVNQLDHGAEVFYRRLLSKVDDHGLFDARLNMLRTSLYPLRVDRVREADCSRWLAACEEAGLIVLYHVGGKPFGQVLNTQWQARSDPKHPPPSAADCAPPNAAANSCAQLHAPAPVFVVGDGDVVDTPPTPRRGAGRRSAEEPEGFKRFWAAWPASTRKAARAQCLRKWQAKGLEERADQLVAHVAAMAASEGWTKQAGEFVPAPLVYLNQDRWEAPTEQQQVAQQQAVRWHETQSGIRAKGMELGVGDWDREAFDNGRGEPFPAYEGRVRRAVAEREGQTA